MKTSNVASVPARVWILRAKTLRAKTLRTKTLRTKTRRTKTTRRLVLSAAALSLALLLLAPSARAQDMPALPDDAAAANFDCAAEPLTGSGPGFSSSRDASEEAARAAWLEKAKAVFPEASWETAKDANLACAVQGLYSKCFAQGIPCRPKAEDAGTTTAAPDSETPAQE